MHATQLDFTILNQMQKKKKINILRQQQYNNEENIDDEELSPELLKERGKK